MLCPSEGVPDRGPHQGAGTAASVSRQALGPLWHIKSEKMVATIRRAEADFPTRERPKNRIRGLPIERGPGTWLSFLGTISNFPEFLQALSDLFRVFATVHRNFPEILLVTGATSAKSPSNPPIFLSLCIYSKFLLVRISGSAKSPNKSSDFFRVFAPDPIYSEILPISTRKNSE